jgi:hypothetical protein
MPSIDRVFNPTHRSYGRSFGSPDQAAARTGQADRKARYALLWSYYDGTAFADLADWVAYRDAKNLPFTIRNVGNIVKKAIDFYFLHIYSGGLAEDGRRLPKGALNALPIEWGGSKPDMLADAVAQTWEWSNWPTSLRSIVLHAGIMGNTLVEVVNDPARRTVMYDQVWPGYVSDLVIDPAGNVKQYKKSYMAYDPVLRVSYEFAKLVTTREVRTFRNGEPWDYVTNRENGPNAVRANPYGFVPARWIPFWDVGTWWGEPVLFGAHAAYDELLGMWSQWNDKVRLNLEMPYLVTGDITPGSIQREIDQWYEAEQERPVDAQPLPMLSWRLIETTQGTEFKSVDLDISAIEATVKFVKEGFLDNLPEVRFEEMLREMQSLDSAPAMERAMLDVATRYRTIGGQMDLDVKRLQQMAVAVGAHENGPEGSWTKNAVDTGNPLDDRHAKFDGFSLDSFADGDLDHDILPRPLVPPTEAEQVRMAAEKQAAGVPVQQTMLDMGYDEDDWLRWEQEGWVAPGTFTNPQAAAAARGTETGVTTPPPVTNPREATQRIEELLGGA